MRKGVQKTIAIPLELFQEIEALIKDYGDEAYSVNSFSSQAVKEMVELIKSGSRPRRYSKLIRMYDAALAEGLEFGESARLAERNPPSVTPPKEIPIHGPPAAALAARAKKSQT